MPPTVHWKFYGPTPLVVTNPVGSITCSESIKFETRVVKGMEDGRGINGFGSYMYKKGQASATTGLCPGLDDGSSLLTNAVSGGLQVA